MQHNPMWKTNLAICATLVALVAGYFFYQVQAASEQFRKNSREHSKVLAAAVELNIRNAILSNAGLEVIIADFLKNSAHFISYLNIIEQFTPLELSAFARETGLAGITIVTDNGATRLEGPKDWGPKLNCNSGKGLMRHEEKQLYSLISVADPPIPTQQNCVIVGFSAHEVEKVQKDVSVETLLERLSNLPGIDSVQLVSGNVGGDNKELPARLVEQNGEQFSETRISIGDSDLIVVQQAGHFARRLHQMRTEFFIFVLFLIAFGISSSWWLYHAEKMRIKEAREYEQDMARQHEEATLGRAAATIAHEIRNPLNAIGMGLQRLQLETEGLDEEHSALLVSMREAVDRSNTIVTSLQRYVRSFELNRERVDLAQLLHSVLHLYGPACKEQGIDVVLSGEDGYIVTGDSQLLGQMFENVIKNAVEAQPRGGFCQMNLQRSEDDITVTLTNGGFMLSPEDTAAIFEPYFTSKTQGTGLGLAISRKIVEAHGGTITAQPDTRAQELTVIVNLPRDPITGKKS